MNFYVCPLCRKTFGTILVWLFWPIPALKTAFWGMHPRKDVAQIALVSGVGIFIMTMLPLGSPLSHEELPLAFRWAGLAWGFLVYLFFGSLYRWDLRRWDSRKRLSFGDFDFGSLPVDD